MKKETIAAQRRQEVQKLAARSRQAAALKDAKKAFNCYYRLAAYCTRLYFTINSPSTYSAIGYTGIKEMEEKAARLESNLNHYLQAFSLKIAFIQSKPVIIEATDNSIIFSYGIFY